MAVSSDAGGLHGEIPLGARFPERDLSAIFNCAPVPQLLIQANHPDFTVLAASDAYLQMSGVGRDRLIGKNLSEVFTGHPANVAFNDLRDLRASLRTVIATRTPDQLPTQHGDFEGTSAGEGGFEQRFRSARNTPIPGADGRVAYILLTVEDVTEKVRAEKKAQAAEQLHQISEKRFRQMVEASAVGILIGDSEGAVSYANPALLKLIGYTEQEVAAGGVRWDQLTPPEYEPLDTEARKQLRATGVCQPYEKVYIAKSGRHVPILLTASLLAPLNGLPQAAGFVFDLTERKQSERNAFLLALDDALHSLDDPREMAGAAVKMLCEHLRADRCSAFTWEAGENIPGISAEYAMPGRSGSPGDGGAMELSPEVTARLRANLPYMASYVDDAGTSIGAMIAMPLHKAGRLVSALSVTLSEKTRTWLPEEMEAMRVVANRCWESMERARVAAELRASEQRLRLAQRAARIGSFEWLLKERKIFWTPEIEALYGLPEGSLEGSSDGWRKHVVPADAERALAVARSCIEQRESECRYEFRAILPDGALRWLRGQSQFFYDQAGAPERMIGVHIDVDAQKKAEDLLRESERRLRAIFDGTYEHIGLLSPDGMVLEANRAALEFAGNALADVAGKPFWEGPWFASAPCAPAVREAVAKAAAGEFVRFEAALKSPSGERLTFDLSFHPVRNERGEVVLIVPEGRDITERKAAEERLRQQWHTFDTALSNTPDLTYTLDLQGRFTYANRQLCRVAQRSLQETVGKSVSELYPQQLAERIHSQIRQIVATQEVLRDQTPFRLPSGEVREYEYIYAPVIGENGEVVAIAGSTRDFTDRKQAEERLRNSEMQFRQLFDSLPQLVWSSTAGGYDDLFNKQWFEYTGLAYGDVGGDGWKIIHPDDLPTAMERWKHSLATGAAYEVEYRCRRHDGQYRWFLGRAKPVLDEQGAVLRWFGTCTDIHDKKESETALRKAHPELEEFSFVASHDLQEPLRMVGIYVQLILLQLGSERADIAQYADFVRQGVKRMEVLLSDLLTFSRAVNTDALPLGVADLSASLAEAKSVLRSRLEESGASIAAAPLPRVRGDTAQLAHIFQNLLSNSLKYRQPERPPEIAIAAVRQAGEWIVSVEDNGIGFEPQYAQRIFGLFKRLHKEEYPGTGLGLAICQRIVERYGGRMWAEGRPGEGATFYFALPAVDE
jgi:PAS domain S-box-containing protein